LGEVLGEALGSHSIPKGAYYTRYSNAALCANVAADAANAL